MLEQGRDWGQARPDQVRDRKVKGRCKGLGTGSCNYREIRNLAEEEERQAKWVQATAPAEPKDFIKENKAQLSYYTDSYEECRYRAEVFEARLVGR
eukprot:g27865.t1